MNNYEYILVSEFNSHLEIALNRPEKRNALNDQLVLELKHIFNKTAHREDIKTISLKGNGNAFCSGADLEHLQKMRNFSREENLKDSLSLADLYLLIYTHPKPIIAVVEGAALAGGCGLASACDFVLASENAKFGYPEVKIGFIAALVSVFLTRQVGERTSKDLLLTGKTISATEAKNIGLINEVFSVHEIIKAEQELISSLSLNSSFAIKSSKKLFNSQIEAELNNLAQLNAEYRESGDFIEGITSFIEKRKPKWSV